MKKLYLILITFLLFSCNKNVSTNPDFNDLDIISQADGFTKVYYPDSKILKFEGYIKNSLPDGFCKFYFENGKVKLETHFKSRKKNGFTKSYFENGNVQHEGHYSNGEKKGYWKYYTEDGKLENELTYK